MAELTELVINKYGEECRNEVLHLDKLVKDYVNSNFPTNKANSTIINNSFTKLNEIYNYTISKEGRVSNALIVYLVETFKANENNAFNLTRINMMPAVKKDTTASSNYFVADMNQLFYNLARVNTYEELRKYVRVEDILANVRTTRGKIAIEQYLASIDF